MAARSLRLIFCLGNNPEAATIARECGWDLGARSDHTIYPHARPLSMIDIHWRDYDWQQHLAVCARERPWLAAVPDLERMDQIPAAMEQAEALAPYCENLLFIPKAYDVIDRIPAAIGGTPIVLGYSVPTAYGGTGVPLWEFGQRPVHLLGGSPRKQKELAQYLNVVSVDGNMAWKLATRFTRAYGLHGGHGPQVLRATAKDAPYQALRRSLTNLRAFWGQ